MRLNPSLLRATLSGALGGLLFGFDTVVISGAIDALVRLYGLNPQEKGFTVAIGLVGTVIGALGAGQVGQRLGSRETLRITAVLYVVSALGCGLAWNWPAFMAFRFIGGLGHWRIVGAGSGVHCGACAGQIARPARGGLPIQCRVRHHGGLHFQLRDFAPCTWARRNGDCRWASLLFRLWFSWRCSSEFRAARAGRSRRIAWMKRCRC